MSIHPTAFIDPLAEIADDVEIGPFAVVEAGAKIGRSCILHGHAQVLASVELGENCEIGHCTVVGAAPQDLKFDHAIPSGVRLGSGNVLREHVTIHRSSKEGGVTLIGQDNYFMVGSHVGHDSIVGDRNILANHCLLGGHVILGNGTFLGGGSAFHQFVRIGNLCMVKGLAAISQDVPPYTMASHTNQIRGLNVVGMRRAGLSATTRQNVKEAFHQMYLAGLNHKEALASTDDRTWEPEASEFIDFFRVSTSRGICHPG
ncbi:MAG: acyl-ACP--UDP-N-acetylglucosamine O-acyltransferase [Verrucomicrobiae bacterium]|nr:acyl-ACP--UDP-N-acetylglucosamine O-acyltransferase [Verrucomicrobiae bacterium]